MALALLLISVSTVPVNAAARPLTSVSAVEALNIDQAKSLQRLRSVVGTLEVSVTRALANKSPNYALQEALITGAGAVVSPLFARYQASPNSRSTSEALFIRNQAMLNQILHHYQGVIRNYQENRLDGMDSPDRFFKSAAWQSPQKLISLASYWLGWNGYYASLLMAPEAAARKTMLQQAVTGFSRSFIDFQEDEITTRSLYGRGLVYGQLRQFGHAAYDFKSVREKVGRDDSLYLNCLYQEAVISHEMGKDKVAGKLLAAISENRWQLALRLLQRRHSPAQPNNRAM